jgi:hypothetical protein
MVLVEYRFDANFYQEQRAGIFVAEFARDALVGKQRNLPTIEITHL